MGVTERKWLPNTLMNLVIAQSHQLLLIRTWVAFAQQTLHLARQQESSVGTDNLITVPLEKAALAMESLR